MPVKEYSIKARMSHVTEHKYILNATIKCYDLVRKESIWLAARNVYLNALL